LNCEKYSYIKAIDLGIFFSSERNNKNKAGKIKNFSIPLIN
jgi:hypothetical protein